MKKYTTEMLPTHWRVSVYERSERGRANYYEAILLAVLRHPIIKDTHIVNVVSHRGYKEHTAIRRALDHAWELDHPAYAQPGPKQTELKIT